jgi:hypothetical protein
MGPSIYLRQVRIYNRIWLWVLVLVLFLATAANAARFSFILVNALFFGIIRCADEKVGKT